MASFSLLCLLLIVIGHASGFLFEITSSRKELSFLEKETLEIECSYNPYHSDYDSELQSVLNIHIVRKDNSNRWPELATLQADGTIWKLQNNFQAYGAVGPTVNDTFLKLFWDTATQEELGMYRCEVFGKDEDFKYDVKDSNVLTIFKHNLTTEELLDVSQKQLDSLQLEFDKFKKSTVKKMALIQKSVQDLKNDSRDDDDKSDDDIIDVDKLKSDIIQSVLTNVSEQVENMTCSRISSCMLNMDTKDTKDDIQSYVTLSSNLTSTTEQSLRAVLTTPALPQMAWPDGRFALMNTASGCPSSPLSPNWKTGYNKYHTESVDDNHDNVTSPNHLAEPVMEIDRYGNHFLYMHFCSSFNRNPTEVWPAGSYCINMVGSTCPAGFQAGYIDVDEEDDNFAGQHAGVLPVMLYYCCRKDGSPYEAIRLPPTKPFYLYRFGGQCQKVEFMTVTPERMLFDTENDNNEDVFENDNHPDGKKNDLEIELCYYS